MSVYYVAVKDKLGNFHRYEVPYEVSTYIKQLEHYINNPEKSKLKEIYKERFPE